MVGVFWACLGAVLCCFPVAAQAVDEIVLVLSSDARPYLDAAESLESSLRNEQLSSKTVLSKELAAFGFNSFKRKHSPKFWVAIGSRAAAQLNTLLPASTQFVFCMVANPEKVGIDSGREHVAGVSVSKSLAEQFAIIQIAMPELNSIGMLYRSSSEESMHGLARVKKQLPEEWRLEAVDVDAMNSVSSAIQDVFQRNVHLVWTKVDASIYNRATVKSLLLASLRSGIPVFGFSGSLVKAGALLGFEADPVLQGKYAASMVLKCLDQNTPKPCFVASGVTLSVNLVVADRLGITLPAELLNQAELIKRR